MHGLDTTLLQILSPILRREFVNYVLIGLYGLLVAGFVFYVTYEIVGVTELTANVLGSAAGMLNNFVCNAVLNFQKTDAVFIRLARYVVVGLIGIVFTSITFSLILLLAPVSPYIAWLGATLVTVTVQFLVNSRWSFGEVRMSGVLLRQNV